MQNQSCPYCSGYGYFNDILHTKCLKCNGEGIIREVQYKSIYKKCPFCGGCGGYEGKIEKSYTSENSYASECGEISISNFGRIREGMSYSQVSDILGLGTLQTEERNVSIFVWEKEDPLIVISCLFCEGELVSKALVSS